MLTLTNAKLFDGQKMLPGQWNVTLEGDRIASVSDKPAIGGTEVIDLGGMTLMPGLITGHFHADFYKFDLAMAMRGEQLGKELPPGVGMAMGVRQCKVLLDSGFTGYIGAGCAHDIDASLIDDHGRHLAGGQREPILVLLSNRDAALDRFSRVD